MKKLLTFACILLMQIIIAQTSEPVSLEVQEGTVVKVELQQDLNGKHLQKGDKIEFLTHEPVIIGDRVAIPAGLKVSGTVTDAAKSKGLGKKGALSFTINYLYLPNGKVVKLSAEVSKNLKGSGAVVAASAVLVTPVALLIKGKNAKYKKGEVFETYVAETVAVN